MKRILHNRNVMTVSVTSSVIGFFQQVYNPFWSLYLGALGLSIMQIGILSAIRISQQFLLQLPGGMLTDRIGRKKVLVLVAFIRIFTPIVFYFSTSWEGILFASILSGFDSISGPAFQALVAESLPLDQIGAGYGMYNTIQRVPSVFTALIGGILMDAIGVKEATKLCFIGASIIAFLVFLARYFLVTETLTPETKQKQDMLRDVSEVFPLLKGTLRGMLVASAVTQFATGLSSAYVVIYAVTIIGLSKTEWGLITTIMSVLSLITAIPGGMMSDKYDRRKLLVFSRAIEPATNIGYITFRSLWQIIVVRVIAGAAMGISGANVEGLLGGPAWSALLADLVPSKKRGRLSGLMGTISGLAAFFAPYIGAYGWTSEIVGPDMTLIISSIIGVSSSAILWLYVRDPRTEAKKNTPSDSS